MTTLTLHAAIEQWPLTHPFRITGYTWEHIDVLLVTLEKDGLIGRGEAAGVYYKSDRPDSMLQQVEGLRSKVEAGLSRDALQSFCRPVARVTRSIARYGIWKQSSAQDLPGRSPDWKSRGRC